MSVPAIFVDANVLIYAEDQAEVEKRSVARGALLSLAESGAGAVSTQVLGEFSSVVVRRFRSSWTAADAWTAVEQFASLYRVCEVTLPVVRLAGWAAARYQMHYFDAQIWATARLEQISVVLTEDLPSAPEIEGVRFVDPFHGDFDVDSLLEEVGKEPR